MARVMLVTPWSYHDEGRTKFDSAYEWRNGPYNLLLLGTILKQAGHDVRLVDLAREIVGLGGDVTATLSTLSEAIAAFRPDIIAFSFFSIHFFEVKQALTHARATCGQIDLSPDFVAGGIHATIDPLGTRDQLGFDLVFVGEGEIGLAQLADGADPTTIPGVVHSGTILAPGAKPCPGKQVTSLDQLPYPDWSLCDYKFYGFPTYARMKFRTTGTLDMVMGRGCVYKCAFCAYNALSSVRFYSAEYLIEHVEQMHKDYSIDSVYFTDSTIGNNRPLVAAFSELMIRRGTNRRVRWLANIRPNQVNEEFLRLMWRGGCRYLLYGFESNSQRMLDLMVKGMKVESNEAAAELHNKLGFPYHASMLLGYPGETEADIMATLDFLRRRTPPSIGINWYAPLPGSPDYDKLKAEGVISTDDPMEWRRIGEVNTCRVYADIPEARFRELYQQACQLAYQEIPAKVNAAWQLSAATSWDEEDTKVHPALAEHYPFNFRRRLVTNEGEPV